MNSIKNVNLKIATFLMICGLINLTFLLGMPAISNIINIGLFFFSCAIITLSTGKIRGNIAFATIIPIAYYLYNITLEATSFLFFIFYMWLGFYLGANTKTKDIETLGKKLFFAFILLEITLLATQGSIFNIEGNGSLRLISTAGGAPSTSFILLILSIIFLSFNNWKFYIPTIFLLFLTGNRISILALIVCILYFTIINKKNRRQLVLLGIIALPFAMHYFQKIMLLLRFTDKYGDLNTGTFDGRLVHWNWALHKFENAPLLTKLFGHGINSTKEMFFSLNYYLGEKTGSGAMHNEYIRLLIEMGISIFPILIIAITITIKRSLKLPQSQSKLVIGTLLSILICAITDNILYSYSSFMFISLFLIGNLAFNIKTKTASFPPPIPRKQTHLIDSAQP